MIQIRFIKTVLIDETTGATLSTTETVESSLIGLSTPPVATVKKEKPPTVYETDPRAILYATNGVIQLTKGSMDLIGANVGDRVFIEYSPTKTTGLFIPVISVSSDERGNKVSKTFSIPFKGKQMKMLNEYGTEFSLEQLSNTDYALVSKTGEDKLFLTDKDLAPMPDVSAKDIPLSSSTGASPMDFNLTF